MRPREQPNFDDNPQTLLLVESAKVVEIMPYCMGRECAFDSAMRMMDNRSKHWGSRTS
jgi:hypothetical protein